MSNICRLVSPKKADTTPKYIIWTKRIVCFKLNYSSVLIRCSRKIINKRREFKFINLVQEFSIVMPKTYIFPVPYDCLSLTKYY